MALVGLVEVEVALDWLLAAVEVGAAAEGEVAVAMVTERATGKGVVGLELGLVEQGLHGGFSAQRVRASTAGVVPLWQRQRMHAAEQTQTQIA